jgi:type II secretory pathway pseudopilin PulG
LIELMAVVLIMAILIAVGIVALPKMSKALAVDRGAHVVLNTFEHARQIAITRHVDAYVVLGSFLKVAVQNQNFGPHLYVSSTNNPNWKMIDPVRDSLILPVVPPIPMPLNCEILYPVKDTRYNPSRYPRGWPANGVTGDNTPSIGLNGPYLIYNGYSNVAVTTWYNSMGYSAAGAVFCVTFDKYGRATMTTTTVVAEITSTYDALAPWSGNTANKLGIVTEKGTGRIYITRDVPMDISSWF